MEVTTLEGVHLLLVFPPDQTATDRTRFEGWLQIPGTGDTSKASKCKLDDIIREVDRLGGIVAIPHPKTPKIGILDSARKLNIKSDWLESGHLRLMQCHEDLVKYIDHDEKGSFVNRYVLASARPRDIEASSYCLAPFNKSDFDGSLQGADISAGCSWFRMEQLTVEGLKQVACEPHTRISRVKPVQPAHDCILGLSVTGGYSNGEAFRFSDSLNTIIGQNYAGKSAVLDYVRFAVRHDHEVSDIDRQRLLKRLYGILQPHSSVELYLRHKGELYVTRRTFEPETTGHGPSLRVDRCVGEWNVYRLDGVEDELVPVDDLRFPLEVYEQGHIGRLHDDAYRQLEMIDAFAGVATLKKDRREIIEQLNESAQELSPLYSERENLGSAIGGLKELEEELAEKKKHLPDDAEEQKWSRTASAVLDLGTVCKQLEDAASEARVAGLLGFDEDATSLDKLFGQSLPDVVDGTTIVHAGIVTRLRDTLEEALKKVGAAKDEITSAIDVLKATAKTVTAEWEAKKKDHESSLAKELSSVGVESPKELINRVGEIRAAIRRIKEKDKPRLAEVSTLIHKKETIRDNLLSKLRKTDEKMTAERQKKALELTEQLGGQVTVVVKAGMDDALYLQQLEKFAAQQNVRKDQLPLVTAKLTPIQLAEALRNGGSIGGTTDPSETKRLRDHCHITEHTEKVLCRIAEDIHNLNDLQTTPVQDVPEIRVKRRGEDVDADLRNLSPGEQSAAILLLALQTRSMPLILDQPEDELGYDFVVHLVVPSVLRAKFSRQLLVVTLDPNVAVLGDADFIVKMQNKPHPEGGRHCGPAVVGCFESPDVTQSLLDLEGGKKAFQYRLHRYSLPKASQPDIQNLLASAMEVAPAASSAAASLNETHEDERSPASSPELNP